MERNNILNFDGYLNSFEIKINRIIDNATYSEICNYIKLLPGSYETDDVIYYWVTNSINEYYQKVACLEKMKNDNNKQRILITEQRLYAVYCLETYNYISISFDEFVTFSKLVDETFGNEDTDNIHVYDSHNDSLGFMFNIANVTNIKPIDEIPYTLNRLKLDTLFNILHKKREAILKENVELCGFNDDNVDALFSNKLAKKIRKTFR